MKKLSKVLALVLAFALVLGLGATAFADGTGTITITPPTGTQSTATNTYKIYKVFDADGNGTNISYKLVSGKTTAPAGFTVDSAGNVTYTGSATAGTDGKIELTAADIAAIAAYVTDADLVDTATSTGTAAAVSKALPNGYYYITTSTGTVVTIDSTNPTATVEDKNVVPPVVKSAGTAYSAEALKAIAAVGTSQPFTAQITKTKGAKNLTFTDTMTNMKYNGDVAITVSAGTAPTDAQAVVTTTDDGFTVHFTDAYIATLADNTIITLNYTATITSDALSVNPAKNTASLTYGDNNTPSSTPPSVEVYNAKFTVTKKDGDSKALEGAGFVIKNAAGAYYKLNAASGTTPASITWYTLPEGTELAAAIAAGNITEYKSDSAGAVQAFTGLKDGTYTLVESTTPAGYNTAADSTFTIAAGDYTADNLEQTSTVINISGAVLPSTGGIGTTIFYIVGSLLVMGAGILLVTKRRMSIEK